MKINKLFILFISLGLFIISACSSDDDNLNSEADIIKAVIENQEELLLNNPSITNEKVTFTLKNSPENFNFSPEFELSEGATIDPENGVELDFSTDQTYVVTSEDQQYSKTYTVSFVYENEVEAEAKLFSFEEVSSDNEGNYHEFYETNSSDQKIYNWGTGNPGYSVTLAITGGELLPESYPTYQTDGYEGKGVRMETKSTGELGAAFGAPLAAGNLFLGEFLEITQPDPRQGVLFGRNYAYETAPKMIKGFFKYQRGEDFQVNSEEGSSFTEDGWNAYGILFEKTEEDNFLRGDFSLDDPKIVSIAMLTEAESIEAEDWTEFSIPFETVEGKSFDPNQEYMYTIVFSASREGDLFNGAVGSVLHIDEVELLMENPEE